MVTYLERKLSEFVSCMVYSAFFKQPFKADFPPNFPIYLKVFAIDRKKWLTESCSQTSVFELPVNSRRHKDCNDERLRMGIIWLKNLNKCFAILE